MPNRSNPIPRFQNSQPAHAQSHAQPTGSNDLSTSPAPSWRDGRNLPPRHRASSWASLTNPNAHDQHTSANSSASQERRNHHHHHQPRSLPPPRFQRKQRPPRVQNILASSSSTASIVAPNPSQAAPSSSGDPVANASTLTFGQAYNWGPGTTAIASLPMSAIEAASGRELDASRNRAPAARHGIETRAAMTGRALDYWAPGPVSQPMVRSNASSGFGGTGSFSSESGGSGGSGSGGLGSYDGSNGSMRSTRPSSPDRDHFVARSTATLVPPSLGPRPLNPTNHARTLNSSVLAPYTPSRFLSSTSAPPAPLYDDDAFDDSIFTVNPLLASSSRSNRSSVSSTLSASGSASMAPVPLRSALKHHQSVPKLPSTSSATPYSLKDHSSFHMPGTTKPLPSLPLMLPTVPPIPQTPTSESFLPSPSSATHHNQPSSTAKNVSFAESHVNAVGDGESWEDVAAAWYAYAVAEDEEKGMPPPLPISSTNRRGREQQQRQSATSSTLFPLYDRTSRSPSPASFTGHGSYEQGMAGSSFTLPPTRQPSLSSLRTPPPQVPRRIPSIPSLQGHGPFNALPSHLSTSSADQRMSIQSVASSRHSLNSGSSHGSLTGHGAPNARSLRTVGSASSLRSNGTGNGGNPVGGLSLGLVGESIWALGKDEAAGGGFVGSLPSSGSGSGGSQTGHGANANANAVRLGLVPEEELNPIDASASRRYGAGSTASKLHMYPDDRPTRYAAPQDATPILTVQNATPFTSVETIRPSYASPPSPKTRPNVFSDLESAPAPKINPRATPFVPSASHTLLHRSSATQLRSSAPSFVPTSASGLDMGVLVDRFDRTSVLEDTIGQGARYRDAPRPRSPLPASGGVFPVAVSGRRSPQSSVGVGSPIGAGGGKTGTSWRNTAARILR